MKSKATMVTRVLSGIVLVGSLSGFTNMVTAGETTPAAVRVAGELSKIDGKTITITTAGNSTVVTCNETTKISRDAGGSAAFGDLQVGQQVRAYCNVGDNVAQSVHIAKSSAPGGSPK